MYRMVDLTFLKKFTKEDPKKMRRYISLYLDVSPKTFDQMKQNLQDKDWEQLRINAHSLKPQADFMGILKLKEKLSEIEETIKLSNLNSIEKLCNSTYEIHLESQNELKKILESL